MCVLCSFDLSYLVWFFHNNNITLNKLNGSRKPKCNVDDLCITSMTCILYKGINTDTHAKIELTILFLFSIANFWWQNIILTEIVLRSGTDCTESKNIWWHNVSKMCCRWSNYNNKWKNNSKSTTAIAKIIAVLIFIKCNWKFSSYMSIFCFMHECVGSHNVASYRDTRRHRTTWIRMLRFLYQIGIRCNKSLLPLFLTSLTIPPSSSPPFQLRFLNHW